MIRSTVVCFSYQAAQNILMHTSMFYGYMHVQSRNGHELILNPGAEGSMGPQLAIPPASQPSDELEEKVSSSKHNFP